MVTTYLQLDRAKIIDYYEEEQIILLTDQQLTALNLKTVSGTSMIHVVD